MLPAMNTTVCVLLVVALCALMGLAATRLPKLYRRQLFKPLYAAAFLVLCFASAWGMGAMSTLGAITPLLAAETLALVRGIVAAHREFGVRVQIACAAFFAYALWLDTVASGILRRRRRLRPRRRSPRTH